MIQPETQRRLRCSRGCPQRSIRTQPGRTDWPHSLKVCQAKENAESESRPDMNRGGRTGKGQPKESSQLHLPSDSKETRVTRWE